MPGREGGGGGEQWVGGWVVGGWVGWVGGWVGRVVAGQRVAAGRTRRGSACSCACARARDPRPPPDPDPPTTAPLSMLNACTTDASRSATSSSPRQCWMTNECGTWGWEGRGWVQHGGAHPSRAPPPVHPCAHTPAHTHRHAHEDPHLHLLLVSWELIVSHVLPGGGEASHARVAVAVCARVGGGWRCGVGGVGRAGGGAGGRGGMQAGRQARGAWQAGSEHARPHPPPRHPPTRHEHVALARHGHMGGLAEVGGAVTRLEGGP